MSRTESPATLEPVDRTDEVRPPGGLVEGMHLDQPTFHALYEATSPGVRAELIDGVVYMPSPVRRTHGRQRRASIVWLNHYEENTPGVESLDDATAVLGKRSEPQPDATLRILTEHGGQTRDENDYIVGAPELVLEVARSTRYLDLGPKLKDYERAGVLEYIVLASKPDEVIWYGREDGTLVAKPLGDAMTESTAQPFSRDSGSIPRRSSVEIRNVSERCSTSASPRPNTRRSSSNWPPPRDDVLVQHPINAGSA